MGRDSFIFYRSFYHCAKEMPDKERLILFDAICAYALDGENIELNGICKAIFAVMSPQIDANNKKYENGKKGGRPRLNSDLETKQKPNRNQTITKSKPKVNQTETKQKPNNNPMYNVNENDNENYNANKNEEEEKETLSNDRAKKDDSFFESNQLCDDDSCFQIEDAVIIENSQSDESEKESGILEVSESKEALSLARINIQEISIIENKQPESKQKDLPAVNSKKIPLPKRRFDFECELYEIQKELNFSSEIRNQFFEYWTEENKSKTKMRFELEKTWVTKKRVQRWINNNKNFVNNGNSTGNNAGNSYESKKRRLVEQAVEAGRHLGLTIGDNGEV